MSTKHTQGPWESPNGSGFMNGVPCKMVRQCDGFNPMTVAYVIHYDQNEEHDANARLIAAAPELLEAHSINAGDLLMLRKAIHAGDPKEELLLRLEDILNRTRYAFDKATGTN